jgi:hypothetical protein
VRRRRGNAGLAYFAEHPRALLRPATQRHDPGWRRRSRPGRLSLTWRASRTPTIAGAPPDPHDDRPSRTRPRSAAGSRPRYAPHRNLTLQRVARGDAAAGVRRPAGALPRRYVACGAGKGSRVQHVDSRPHDDRKVASTTYVAPCRRWAGSNTAPRRLCATSSSRRRQHRRRHRPCRPGAAHGSQRVELPQSGRRNRVRQHHHRGVGSRHGRSPCGPGQCRRLWRSRQRSGWDRG